MADLLRDRNSFRRPRPPSRYHQGHLGHRQPGGRARFFAPSRRATTTTSSSRHISHRIYSRSPSADRQRAVAPEETSTNAKSRKSASRGIRQSRSRGQPKLRKIRPSLKPSWRRRKRYHSAMRQAEAKRAADEKRARSRACAGRVPAEAEMKARQATRKGSARGDRKAKKNAGGALSPQGSRITEARLRRSKAEGRSAVATGLG